MKKKQLLTIFKFKGWFYIMDKHSIKDILK